MVRGIIHVVLCLSSEIKLTVGGSWFGSSIQWSSVKRDKCKERYIVHEHLNYILKVNRFFLQYQLLHSVSVVNKKNDFSNLIGKLQ